MCHRECLRVALGTPFKWEGPLDPTFGSSHLCRFGRWEVAPHARSYGKEVEREGAAPSMIVVVLQTTERTKNGGAGFSSLAKTVPTASGGEPRGRGARVKCDSLGADLRRWEKVWLIRRGRHHRSRWINECCRKHGGTVRRHTFLEERVHQRKVLGPPPRTDAGGMCLLTCRTSTTMSDGREVQP